MKTSSKKNPAPLAPTSASVGKVSFENVSAEPSKNTKPVTKKNTQSANPAIENHKVRPHVKATSGARYGIRVKFQKQEAHEASSTLAEGKLLPSAIKRQSQNFSAGTADHN